MSFYRKLKVNGKEYEYHVGKWFVKIKGIGNITKGGFYNDYRSTNAAEDKPKYTVSPGMIADYINGKKVRDIKLKRYTPACNCKKPLSEKNWRCDPFDAEIHEVYRYAMWCDECHKERSWDI